MPELPEVETVRRELEQTLVGRGVFQKITLLRPDLRDPIPKKLIQKFCGEEVLAVRRRAKYLLFDFPSGSLISHLGMTGAWRCLAPTEKPTKSLHDHVVLEFASNLRLAFRDPRRFGILDMHWGNDIERHKRFSHLGPEPLDESLTPDMFFHKLKSGQSPIKTHLMNQKVLVGVGNIYASEALFRAGISPRRKAGKLQSVEAFRLLTEIREVLNKAIAAGGSTIRDYKSMHQNDGGFQDQHFVYGREGSPCRNCGTPIRSVVQAGRSTFWCPYCQH